LQKNRKDCRKKVQITMTSLTILSDVCYFLAVLSCSLVPGSAAFSSVHPSTCPGVVYPGLLMSAAFSSWVTNICLNTLNVTSS